MIVNCIQKGSSIIIQRDKGSSNCTAGFLVSFTGSTISCVSSPGSATLIIKNEDGKIITTQQAHRKIWEGMGWKKK